MDKKVKKKVETAVKEVLGNKVLKELKLREGEEDMRQLSREDKDQLQYRIMCDIWCYLNALQKDSTIQTFILIQMAKAQGIDIDKLLNTELIKPTEGSN